MIRIHTNPNTQQEGVYVRCDFCLVEEVRVSSRFVSDEQYKAVTEILPDGWFFIRADFGRKREHGCRYCAEALNPQTGLFNRRAECHEDG